MSIHLWYKEAVKRAEHSLSDRPLMRIQTKHTFKLRLLTFVLALALLWNSLNPAPRNVIRRKREEELPDEKKRNLEPQSIPASLRVAFRLMGETAKISPGFDEDDFEWPEFIDG